MNVVFRGLLYAVTMLTVALATLALSTLLGGCTVSRAQVATQTALAQAAESLEATDRAVSLAGRPYVTGAVDRVRTIHPEGGDEAVSALRSELEPWYQAVEAMEHTQTSLELLQASAETWYATNDLPDDWEPLCAALRGDVEALLGLLEAVGVEVPAAISGATGFVEGICGYAAQLITRED